MKLEIEIISQDIIPPSSPTPHHLNIYNLSSLDQMHLPVFISRVLFYPAHDGQMSNAEKSKQLKKYLSQVLTVFYPFAGRFVNNDCISCNDEGVAFIEARASGKLSDFISDPVPGEFTKFLPYHDDLRDHSLVIQATFFDGGGLALGVGISHRVADAWSYFMFVNSWAAASRGDAHIQSPTFDCTTLFPPRESRVYKQTYWAVNEEDIVTKRFVFSSSKLASIRERYTKKANDGNIRPPTRIEALSAFIWNRFMVSTQLETDTSKIYIIKHTINLRTKVIPPLADNSFGNIMWAANTTAPSKAETEESTYGLVEKIREAIQNIGGDQENTLRVLNESLNAIKEAAEVEAKAEVVPLVFSSTCRFPIDKADFGWGKPVWVGSANLPHRNVVYLLDSLSGKGIEAWVNLKSANMVKFEADKELLAYVSSGHDADVSTFCGI